MRLTHFDLFYDYQLISIIVRIIIKKMSRLENQSEGQRREFLPQGPFHSRHHSNIVLHPQILNGHLHNSYSRQMLVFNHIFIIVLLAQLLLLYLYVYASSNQIQYDLSNKQFASVYLQCSSLCAVFGSVVLLVRFYSQNAQYQLIEDYVEKPLTLVMKIIVILISPYTFLEGIIAEVKSIHGDDDFEVLKINHTLTIFTYFKTAFFAGVLLTHSQYMQPRANRISRLYSSTSGMIFALRGVFKDAPFRFMFIATFFSFVLFTFVFRISEAAVYSSSSAGTIYLNMAWMTMVTMTTLGYGDYIPKTTMGRGIGAVCAIWGALIVAVSVVVLNNTLSLDKRETQTLNVIKKLSHRVQLRQVAGKVIRESLWRLWSNHKHRLTKQTSLKERKIFLEFQRLRKTQRIYQNKDEIGFYNEFFKQLEGANDSIASLTANNLQLVSILTQDCIFKKEIVKKKYEILPKIRINYRRK